MKDSKGREVQDQRVQKQNRGRLLAVGRVIPPDWDYVRITRTKADGNTVWLRITQLKVVEAGT